MTCTKCVKFYKIQIEILKDLLFLNFDKKILIDVNKYLLLLQYLLTRIKYIYILYLRSSNPFKPRKNIFP